MSLYTERSYGRNSEVADIYHRFDAGDDVSMPGPRRLGKTFVLDRVVDAALDRGWRAIKVEVAGCPDAGAFFRELCAKIDASRSQWYRGVTWVKQRTGQLTNPRQDQPGPWYQPLVGVDHQSYFERLLGQLNDDREQRSTLLIDELPIFLKALHDKGPDGIAAACNLMNLLSRLRQGYPCVRWLITGSIGIEPLARVGNYMGVLAKFKPYELRPLSREQARDLVQDLAREGRLISRRTITDAEAEALVDATGWLAAYYLEALAQKLSGEPSEDPVQAQRAVEEAVSRLLQPGEEATFGTWEEHLRKHYHGDERRQAFAVLGALARPAQGLSISGLLAAIGASELTEQTLHRLLQRLHVDGFVTVEEWGADDPGVAFRNPLLRRWWQRFRPQAVA